jgi:hypothetical protein
MKFVLLFLISFPVYAQAVMSDPTPDRNEAVNTVSFSVDKYYPFFGNSVKPSQNEIGVRFTDQNGKYTAFLYFKEQYNSPVFDKNKNTILFFLPISYYTYIMKRLDDNVTAIIQYKEYKDGHSWGEIFFDKYP